MAKIGQAPVVCEVKNKDLYGRRYAPSDPLMSARTSEADAGQECF